MNIEFHYYIIYFLAMRAGFTARDAGILAHSSQFVDSSIFSYTIRTEKELYRVRVTQNYGWWDDVTPKMVYIPFHFFPGDPDCPYTARADGKKNTLNCIPNSMRIKELLIKALKTRNLYRIGIALHTFADAWAHQNFTGIREDWNVLDESSFIPSIGHAQALAIPDDFGAEWIDTRLIEEKRKINNSERIVRAAAKIYRYLSTYNGRSFNDEELVMEEFLEILGKPGDKERDERILDLIIAVDIPKFSRTEWLKEAVFLNENENDEELFTGYSKLLWLRDTVLYRSSLLKKKPLAAKNDFYRSHFYLWNEAAGAHLRDALVILNMNQ